MNSQGQLDAKTLRHISENAEVEHTLLTPFRWLIGAGKAIIYTLLLLSWFIFTLFGWVFNVGEYSLENRREAVCDARAYLSLCDAHEFNETHPHEDHVLDLRSSGQFAEIATIDPEERIPTKPWFNFGDGEWFIRGNDVFRRKSIQMDEALHEGGSAGEALRYAIATMMKVDQVRLPDAPEVVVRQGVIPADALYTKTYVTWGLCLKQECAADASDLNYALFWGDVMWNRPALSEHQQHAVDALRKMNTLPFWLQEFHANGIQDDELIQKKFLQYQHDRNMTGLEFERELQLQHGR